MIVMDQADWPTRWADSTRRLRGRAVRLWDQVKTAPAAERIPVDPLFAAMAVHRIALTQREMGIPLRLWRLTTTRSPG